MDQHALKKVVNKRKKSKNYIYTQNAQKNGEKIGELDSHSLTSV